MFADDWWRRNAKEAARSNPIISYIHIPTYIYIITYLIDIKLEAIVGKAYLHVVSRFSGVQPGGANGCITGSTSKCVP